jgi:hypothetical protein
VPPQDGAEDRHKTGTDQEKLAGKNGVGPGRADAAIVVGKNVRYVIAIYTRHVEDARGGVDNDALVTGARVSRMVYEHFTRQAGDP